MLAPIVAHYARKILLPHNSRIIYHFRVSHGLLILAAYRRARASSHQQQCRMPTSFSVPTTQLSLDTTKCCSNAGTIAYISSMVALFI